MSKSNYLSVAVPEPEKTVKQTGKVPGNDAINDLQAKIDELNEQLIKKNRDDLDREYNIDEDNLSESLLKIIRDLQDRVKALEDIVNP